MSKFFFEEIELEIPESVYEPREDSILLANHLKAMEEKNMKVLEIGCGSGLLSIILAKENDVTSVDINPTAVSITKRNAEHNDVIIKTFNSDLFESVHGKYDLIIFNPPYLPDSDNIPGNETWADNGTINRFIREVPNFLNPNGIILMIVSSLTTEKDVINEFESFNFSVKVLKTQKIAWETLFLLETKLI